MKFQERHTPKPDPLTSDPVAPSCLILNISRIDEHGMVLEMLCGFEIGSTIAMGFHLPSDTPHLSSDLSIQGQHEMETSTFINVESIVVESKMGSGVTGQPAHLVTVLFSQISHGDREQLLHHLAEHPIHPQRPPSALSSHFSTSSASSTAFNEKLRREVTQCIHLN